MTIEYDNGFDRGPVTYVALRGSQCRANVGKGDDKHRCPFQARFLVIGGHDGDVAGFCGLHVNDAWRDMIGEGQTIGQGSWDALHTHCDADLNTVSTVDRDDITCQYRASIVLSRVDGTEFAACRHHAYRGWFEHLELDEDDPTEADAESAEVAA